MRISRIRRQVSPVVWPKDATPAEGAAPAFDRLTEGRGVQTPRTPTALRLRVYLTRGRLDRQIAFRSCHEMSDALALRISQLTDRSTRRRIAAELRGIVEHVDAREPGAVVSAVVIEHAAVRAGREALLGLAERLEATAPVRARGVALARALLTEASSPLRNPYCEQTVNEAVFEVQDALGGPPSLAVEALAA